MNLKILVLTELFGLTGDQLETVAEGQLSGLLLVARKLVGWGFALALVCAGLLAANSIWQVRHLLHATAAEQSDQQWQAEAENLHQRLVDLRLALRTFRATREPAALDAGRTAAAKLEQDLQRLDGASAEPFAWGGQLQQYLRLCRRKLEVLQEQLQSAISEPDSGGYRVRGSSSDELGEIRTALLELAETRRQGTRQRAAEIRRRAESAAGLILAAGLFAGLLVWFAGRALAGERRLWKSEHHRRLQAQAQFQRLLGCLADPVLLLDADLRVRQANLAFCQVLGQTRRDLEGQSLLDRPDWEWNSRHLRTRLEELLARNLPLHDFELNLSLGEGGQEQRFTLTASRVAAPAGLPASVILVFRSQAQPGHSPLLAGVGALSQPG